MSHFIGLIIAAIMVSSLASAQPKPPAAPTTRPVTDKIPNTSVTIDMVQLPGGQITLTDEKGKAHVHEITPFLMGKYEVRWDEWDVMLYGLNLEKEFPNSPDHEKARRAQVDSVLSPSPRPYFPPDRGWGHHGSPAQGYTLRSVKRYVEWLNKVTGKKYRLPTEAEWEWACRAGGPAVNLKGKELEAAAWVDENADERTHPVGAKRPNAWGLYDMLGNVAEFVIRDANDLRGIAAGGSFKDARAEVSSSKREPFAPKWQANDMNVPKSEVMLDSGAHIGFRLVRDVEEPAK